MKKKRYAITSKILVYPGMGGWRFLILPKSESREIQERYGKYVKGWRSIPVRATINKTNWNTSIFPDKKSGAYLLPLKAQIRKIEDITDEDMVTCEIAIV